MAPPLIDRIQQNLQPTTTTWANVPAPITIVVQTGGDFGIPQPIVPPTADVTFSYSAEGALFPVAVPVPPGPVGRELTLATSALTIEGAVVPLSPAAPSPQPADTFTTEVVAAEAPSAPLLPVAPPVLVEVGRAFVFPAGVELPTQPTPLVAPGFLPDTLAEGPHIPLPAVPLGPTEPVSPLVEVGRAFPAQITAPEQPAPSPPDIHGFPGDTFTTEAIVAPPEAPVGPLVPIPVLVEAGPLAFDAAVPTAPPSNAGAFDIPVSPADMAMASDAGVAPPQPANPADFVPSIEGPFVFVFSSVVEAGEFVIVGHMVVPPPLVMAASVEVPRTPSPVTPTDTPAPLVEFGQASVFAPLLEAGGLISIVLAGAIAFAPLSSTTFAAAPLIEARVEEPTQPSLPKPIDWLWSYDIRWEAEPPPNEIRIEEPLRPAEVPWVDYGGPGPWQLQDVVALSSWVPPPQPPIPPTPPPPRRGGGGGGANPIGGSGDCPPCPPCPPTDEEIARAMLFGLFRNMPDPSGLKGPVEPESMVPSGTPRSLTDDFLAWIKVPENQRKVKKAVRYGLGAWAVYKRWKK